MFVGQTTRQQATRQQATRQQGRLPAEATSFIGRQAELARLTALLGHARLVTVTGPAGVGKTRVALRAAALARSGQHGLRFADGVCLVDLAALREPGLLSHAVADALGLPGQSADLPRDAVLTHLRDRQLLLILDTCEHLIDECAVFAEAVIAEAPRVTLLVTSREPLDVIGESSCPIPPLPITGPDDTDSTAVDLFLQRAAAAVPGFTVAPGEMRYVTRLCRSLDGLPLAIELAAVRLRALSLAELASRLDDRLVLLASGQRGGRHATLRDAIDWSYHLCAPAEQALWARLSVFSGPVSIGAAEAVCAGGEIDRDQVMPTMIRLVDKSVLMRAEPDDDDDGGSGSGGSGGGSGKGGGQTTRYLMLETIREFGAERLAADGARGVLRGRLITRYVTMTQVLDHFTDDDQLDRVRELRREHTSIAAALESTLGRDDREEAADGIELAIALSAYWRARGLTAEGVRWLSRAIEHAPAGSAVRALALLRRSQLAALQGDGALADADAVQGLRIGAELGDGAIIARAHLARNLALSVSGRLAEAAGAGAEARRLLAVPAARSVPAARAVTAARSVTAALDARSGRIELEMQLSYLALLNGDVDTAIAYVQRGLDLLGRGRGQWLLGNFHLLAALALSLDGRETESAIAALRALRVKHDLGNTAGTALALEILGWLASRAGRHARAAWLLGAAERLRGLAGGCPLPGGAIGHLHAEAVARSVAALGGRRFDTLSAGAAARRTGQVVAFAVSDADEPADSGDTGIGLPRQLTAREHEIATLVAQGLSNRQVAEQLFISRRTVDAHVEHIFAKLAITSRVTLAIRLRDQPTAAQSSASA